MIVVFSYFSLILIFFLTLSKCLSDLVHYGYYVLVAYQFQELLYWCFVAFFLVSLSMTDGVLLAYLFLLFVSMMYIRVE